MKNYYYHMKYILILFFTLNAMLPVSGYAGIFVSESGTSVMMDKMNTSNASEKQCSDTESCADCCFTHCATSAVTLPAFLEQGIKSIKGAKILSTLKHFYLRTLSPELPPPLV